MSEPVILHPAELSYVFSYMKVGHVVGWGAEPFAAPEEERARDAWYAEGRDRLLAAKRLVPGKQPGRHRFSDEMLRIATALSDPQLVLLAQLKQGDGVRTLTQHLAGADVVELARTGEETFEATLQPSFAAAAGAAAAFAGAAPAPIDDEARIEANHKVFARLDQLADAGEVDKVVAALVQLGATEPEAKSAVLAFARPARSGVVSVLYCAANAIQDAETFSLLTNAAGHTWIVFPPADADGPVVLERSSVGALAARILVTVSARMMLPG